MGWEKMVSVKKGNIGEKIVTEFLEEKGWIVYAPVTNGAHGFDRFAMKNKEEIVYIESKAKARRTYYEDTGINIKHFEDYKRLSEKYDMNIFIFFIDEYMQKIYGNFLPQLTEKCHVGRKIYPSIERGIVYFPLKNMREIADLDEEEASELRSKSTRNYDYTR